MRYKVCSKYQVEYSSIANEHLLDGLISKLEEYSIINYIDDYFCPSVIELDKNTLYDFLDKVKLDKEHLELLASLINRSDTKNSFIRIERF